MGAFGACIALFQAEVASPERATESSGLRHVAFAVGNADLARAQAHLRERDIDFRLEDHGNADSIYLRDPNGNVIELTSYKL